MNKFFYLSAILIIGIVSNSCTKNESAESMIDMLAVQTEEDGNWSFLKPDGTLQYPDEFKSQPSAVVNGYFSVRENEVCVLYKTGDKPTPVKNCDDLKAVGYMNDGLIPIVRDKSRIILADGNGNDKFTLEPYKGKEIVWCETGFSEGRLEIKLENDKYGYVDTKGEMVIKPEYDKVTSFSDGAAWVIKDDVTYAIDNKGTVLFKLKKNWDTHSGFKDGLAVVKDSNEHICFINKKGEVTKCPSKVKWVDGYNSEYYIFSDGENYGIMTLKDNEILVRAKYDRISLYKGNRFVCSNEKKVVILNSKGEVELELDDYERGEALDKFGIFVMEKNTVLLLNDNGTPRKDCEFTNISADYSICYRIDSDYFSLEGMANSIVDKLTASGFGEAKLGSAPGSILSNPRNYTYQSRADLDSLDGKGYRYNYDVVANFTGTIADYTWDYSYGSYDTKYYWNPVTLQAIDINVQAQTSLGADAVKAFISPLEKKGYKQYAKNFKDDNAIILMTGAKMAVYITSEKDSHKLYFGIAELPDKENLQSMKNYIEKQEQNKTGIEEALVEEVVADTVVAEEAM